MKLQELLNTAKQSIFGKPITPPNYNIPEGVKPPLKGGVFSNFINEIDPNRVREGAFSQMVEATITPQTKTVANTNIPQQSNPSAGITMDDLLKGFGNYGATPSAEAVKKMVEAPNRYDVFKNNPYLLPAISIVETSAGQNMTRPKSSPNPQNLINWGIYTDFAPKTQAEAVERALTGIGERSPYYQSFRDTNDLEDFVNTYAPASDGNEGYMDKLVKAMAYFQ